MSLVSIQIGECLLFLQVLVFIRCRPKTESLTRGLKCPVYCKKYSKENAIDVYTDAYEENRLERILE